jgi:hypothetical protein
MPESLPFSYYMAGGMGGCIREAGLRYFPQPAFCREECYWSVGRTALIIYH